ncbi:MAG: hypothetical protein Q4B54_14090, partial [Coriobacteriales bacterium]|nr:hypothetical protein [Coriobacteriales bacterium]
VTRVYADYIARVVAVAAPAIIPIFAPLIVAIAIAVVALAIIWIGLAPIVPIPTARVIAVITPAIVAVRPTLICGIGALRRSSTHALLDIGSRPVRISRSTHSHACGLCGAFCFALALFVLTLLNPVELGKPSLYLTVRIS